MLLKCQECGHDVSSKAKACPNCGCPPPIKNQQNKRIRLPNGFGRITKIGNKRVRNPYRAMVTVGKDSNGRPIGKILKPNGYFRTYNEAYQALVEYHKNPYDLENSITAIQLYERWSEEYFKTLKDPSIRTLRSAWQYCSSIYGMRVSEIRARHIKGCIDQGCVIYNGTERRPSPSTKSRIKSLWNILLDYAVEYEIVDRNYARTFELSQDIVKEREDAKKSHMSFTKEEMSILWENVVIPYVDVILIQCYSGWRPQELGLIKLADVDLENWTFKGGIKTAAGKDRIVPIHTSIRELVKTRYDEAQRLGSEYLINCTDTHTSKSSLEFTYDKYRKRFKNIIMTLGLNPEHRAHDPRKQFITMCKNAFPEPVNEYAIKIMVGHQISDITEKVYTDRNLDWLHKEIEKIEGR